MRRGWVTACVLAVTVAAMAVQPATWEHRTEADFTAGKLDKTVVTSLGEVVLSRRVATLVEPREGLGMISAAVIDARGRVFVAAAPKAAVYRLEKDKLVPVAELPGVMVRSLLAVKGGLLAAVSGEAAGLYRVDEKGKVETVWTDKDVTSVWSVVGGDGESWYVATGPEGRVYRVAGGKGEIVYDSDEENILSLAAAGKGKLIAGTGEKGLVIEIDPAEKTGRVLYDADESEISAIVVAADGSVYAATSDTAKAGPDGEAPSSEEKGKPTSSAPAAKVGAASKPAKAPTAKPVPDGKSTEVKPSDQPKEKPLPAGDQKPEAKSALGPQPVTAPGVEIEAEDVEVEVGKSVEVKVEPAKPKQGGPTIVIRSGGPPRPGPSRPSGPAPESEAQGNAVYRIGPDGFVRPVFRRPVAIFAMTLHDNLLTLATGHGGQMFTVDLAGERTVMLAKLDPKDVTAMAGDGKGRLVLGSADKPGLFELGEGLTDKGTLESKALDAGQIARWGAAEVRATIPRGCSAALATRSGNVAEPDEKTWSAWTKDQSIEAAGDGSTSSVTVASEAGRFLQYRLTLAGNAKATPSVDEVRLTYQVGNLAPVVQAVQVDATADPEERGGGGEAAQPRPLAYRVIKVRTADPNSDKLEMTVEFRRVGRANWIKLAEKLTKPQYAWNTLAAADGTYEVRVTASDSPSNPPATALTDARISRPVVVDNTAPRLTNLAVKVNKGAATLSGTAVDVGSRVTQVEVAVDSNEEWTVLLPADGICDSPKETFSTTIDDLKPGTHLLAVRVTDEFNNVGYSSVEVTVGKGD